MATIQRPDDVRTIQETLSKLGYDTGAADGMWGRDTSAGFNHFVRDVQQYAFPGEDGEQDGLYGARTHEQLQAHIQEMYGDRLSADEMSALTAALGHMIEPVDARGRPDPDGTPLINHLHRPAPLADFESKITPATVLPPVTVTPDDTPEDTVPEDAVPEDTAPADMVPEETAPEDTAPAETVPVTPPDRVFGRDMNDADIAAHAIDLTWQGADALTQGGGLVMDSNTVALQVEAYNKLADLRDSGADDATVAAATADLTGKMDTALNARELAMVAANPALGDYVREQFPGTGDTPQDVLAKLQEPGVIDDILNNRMVGMGAFGTAGPRETLQQMRGIEAARDSIVRVHDVMAARTETAPAAADPAADATADEQSPQERLLAGIHGIDAQQAELMTHNLLGDNGVDTTADSTRAEERVANMRDPEKFARLRDHLVSVGNTDGVGILDQFQQLETQRRGLVQDYEGLTGEQPVAAAATLGDQFKVAAADPSIITPDVAQPVVRQALGLG